MRTGSSVPPSDTIDGDTDGCPVCGGMVSLLGILGDLGWYRCIDCGMDFNSEVESDG